MQKSLIPSASPSRLQQSASSWKNSPAEKEAIASWILAGRSLSKGQRTVFRLPLYNLLISELCRTVYMKMKRLEQIPDYLSIGATKIGEVIGINLAEHMFSMFSFHALHIRHLVYTNIVALCSRCCKGLGTKSSQKMVNGSTKILAERLFSLLQPSAISKFFLKVIDN